MAAFTADSGHLDPNHSQTIGQACHGEPAVRVFGDRKLKGAGLTWLETFGFDGRATKKDGIV